MFPGVAFVPGAILLSRLDPPPVFGSSVPQYRERVDHGGIALDGCGVDW
jgi:hypothetical protein